MIYLPEKMKCEVDVTFKGRHIFRSTEIEVNNCFVM